MQDVDSKETAAPDCSEFTKEIAGYLDAQGRVTQLPTKRRKKLLVLSYLADRLPPDMHCTERQFNELLNTLHTFSDPATLRRELYDYFLIDREQGGKGYSVNADRPSAQDLLDRYCK